ncbi:MAG: hypothetical protein GY765_14850, partial [bacterium]|nr:hypothetical protein [bacterium]
REKLDKVNRRVLEFLEEKLTGNDRITVAYLGVTSYRSLKETQEEDDTEEFFDRIVYCPEQPFQSLKKLELTLESIRDQMGSKGFRREFSFPSVQKQALVKEAAPLYKGRGIRLIWITDGEANKESRKFKDERDDIEKDGPSGVIAICDDIDSYYTFRPIDGRKPVKVHHIQVFFYEAKPAAAGIRVVYPDTFDAVGGGPKEFEGFKTEYNDFDEVFALDYRPLSLQVSWNTEAALTFKSGYYVLPGVGIREKLTESRFTIDVDRVAKDSNYPRTCNVEMEFLFEDKYGSGFLSGPGRTYPIEFKYSATLKYSALIILCLLVALGLYVLFWYRRKIEVVRFRKALPLPIKDVRLDKRMLNCLAMKGDDSETPNAFLISLKKELKRLPGDRSLRVTFKIGLQNEDRLTPNKPHPLKETIHFGDGEKEKEFSLEKKETVFKIPFFINMHCLEDVALLPTLSITGINEEDKQFYTSDTRYFEDRCLLRPNPDDPYRQWRWTFDPSAEEIEVGNEEMEIPLGRIKFERTVKDENIEAEDDELDKLIEQLSFTGSVNQCHVVESNDSVTFEKDAVYFKTPESEPDTFTKRIFAQLYLDPKQIALRRKSNLTFKVTVDFKVKPQESANDEDAGRRLRLAYTTREFDVVITPEYGDLYLAVDFGTTATTCVFGQPEGNEMEGKRAALWEDIEGEKIYLLDSVLLVDVTDPQCLEVTVGPEAMGIFHNADTNQKKYLKLLHSFKTLIGRRQLNIGKTQVEMKEIMIRIFQDLYRRICLYNHEHFRPKHIHQIAVTVPNAFSPNKVSIVKNAWATVKPYLDNECTTPDGDGFVFEEHNIKIIQEAEASAILFAESINLDCDSSIRVLASDNGGGTLDLALVDISKESGDGDDFRTKIELVQKCGYKLGGDTLDRTFARVIWKYMWTRHDDLLEENGFEGERIFAPSCPPGKVYDFRHSLKRMAKEQKEYYSSESGREKGEIFIKGLKPRLDHKEISVYLRNGGEGRARMDSLALIEEYRRIAVDEALADLLAGNGDKKIDHIIYTGRGALFPGLKEKLITYLNQREFLAEGTGDCARLEKIYKHIAPQEEFSMEEMMKYCIAFGALYYAWKSGNERLLTSPRNYGNYFIVQDYDDKMESKLMEEKSQVFIDKESNPKRVFISLVKNGQEYRKNKETELERVAGITKFARASGKYVDIFYGQGDNYTRDFGKNRYKYELAARVKAKKGYKPLELMIYNFDKWQISYNNLIVANSNSKDVVMYVPLSDDDFDNYWPYTREDLEDHG